MSKIVFYGHPMSSASPVAGFAFSTCAWTWRTHGREGSKKKLERTATLTFHEWSHTDGIMST